jgi:hypothetical protein
MEMLAVPPSSANLGRGLMTIALHHRAIGVPFQVHALQMLEGATIRYS